MDEAESEVLTNLSAFESLYARIYSTNLIERLNQENQTPLLNRRNFYLRARHSLLGQGLVDGAERRMGRSAKLSEPRGSGSSLRRRKERLGAGPPVISASPSQFRLAVILGPDQSIGNSKTKDSEITPR